MKKYLWLMLVAVITTLPFQSCGSDDEEGSSVTITEADVLGVWDANVNGTEAIFMFAESKSYLAVFGDNRYKGKWKLEGNTVHGTTPDPIEEYFTFKSISGKVANIQYRNSIGNSYNITATKR